MKDSVLLEGKIYISSRRAAEISHYTTDYVGQLCRAGKVDCRVVGRVWFVTEESVLTHQKLMANSLTNGFNQGFHQGLNQGPKQIINEKSHSATSVASVDPIIPIIPIIPINLTTSSVIAGKEPSGVPVLSSAFSLHNQKNKATVTLFLHLRKKIKKTDF